MTEEETHLQTAAANLAKINHAETLIMALDPEVPTSTVYAINNAQGQNVVVSAQIAKMLSSAKTVYDQSGGALDLSIYPLVKRYLPVFISQ